MALTKRQLEKLLEVIRKHYNGFVYEALGERALTPSELSQLRDAGILRANVRSMIADPVTFGRLIALVPPSARGALSLASLLKRAADIPTTEVEKKAIEYASDHAGAYIKGIRDMTLRDAEAATARASGSALRAVQKEVSEAIANRETVSELKTRLFGVIDNRSRDWLRIAHTEINTAIQNGIHDEIVRVGGADQLVYKRPASGACKHCRRLYLKADGTPRVFRISDLEDSNVGKKANDWEPVIGSSHPWCCCQLVIIPEGYDFKKTKVVKEPFEFDAEAYKVGQIISDEQFARLGPTEQSKIGFDSVLTYTGTTAEPDMEKSFRIEDEDDCFCEHD